jgi:hypothetical protein
VAGKVRMTPLPAAEAEHLDTVIRAAGTRIFPALSALCSAIGFIVARRTVPTARATVLAAVRAEIERAAQLHDEARGRG